MDGWMDVHGTRHRGARNKTPVGEWVLWGTPTSAPLSYSLTSYTASKNSFRPISGLPRLSLSHSLSKGSFSCLPVSSLFVLCYVVLCCLFALLYVGLSARFRSFCARSINQFCVRIRSRVHDIPVHPLKHQAVTDEVHAILSVLRHDPPLLHCTNHVRVRAHLRSLTQSTVGVQVELWTRRDQEADADYA